MKRGWRSSVGLKRLVGERNHIGVRNREIITSKNTEKVCALKLNVIRGKKGREDSLKGTRNLGTTSWKSEGGRPRPGRQNFNIKGYRKNRNGVKKAKNVGRWYREHRDDMPEVPDPQGSRKKIASRKKSVGQGG